MSLHDPDLGNLDVQVASATTTGTTTYYQVQVGVDHLHWTVEQRYSNFAELHAALVADRLVAADLLPGKKLLGSREPAFVERRRAELDAYLRRVVALLQLNLPDVLAQFLSLETFDAGWMLRRRAFQCFVHEAALAGGQRVLQLTPMELWALERLVAAGRTHSFFHESRVAASPAQVVDLATQTPALRVLGSWQPLPGSNIRPHTYRFSVSLLGALRRLWLQDVPIGSVATLAPLRGQLVELAVCGGAVRHLRDVLLCGEPAAAAAPRWLRLQTLTLRDNQLRELDGGAAALAPHLHTLDVGSNAVETVGDLSALPALRLLDVSNNCLSELPALHTRLGGVSQLLLSQNRLQSLAPFARLLSLARLDVSFNQVSCVREVARLAALPLLDDLSLVGNPITGQIDYRARALQRLGARASHVTLDNEQSGQSELDRVLVLQALQTARHGGPPRLRRAWAGRPVTVV